MLEKVIQKFITTWLNHEFSSGGETGSDYKSFQTQYKNIIKKIYADLNNNGQHIDIARRSPNHYCFTCVLSNTSADGTKKYCYISVGDVRWDNGARWNHVLIRTCEHEKDYTGGGNQYIDLLHLQEKIVQLLTR